jgi:predicted ArsR family transcriptional regulator
MDMRALLAPDERAQIGDTRGRVLELLRAAGGPLGVREVAGETRLHPNTARFHLDALVQTGLATREPRPREAPGRPAMAYRVTDGDGPAGQRRYRLLAEMLTSMIAGVMPGHADAAVEAGREWGRYLTGQLPPYERRDPGQAIESLRATLDEIGFAPEFTAEDGGYRLRLRQCPFREVATRHPDVVCALHLGLMQGVLGQLRTPVTAGTLEPFAEPGACIAQLSAERPGD